MQLLRCWLRRLVLSASKGAIETLVRTWAAELSPKIRVNAIATALTDTPLSEKFLDRDEMHQAMAAKYPLGRIGIVADKAAVAIFYCLRKAGGLLDRFSAWMVACQRRESDCWRGSHNASR